MFDVTPITSPKELDCGPTCLKMLLSYYGIEVELDQLIEECGITVAGATGADLMRVARLHGLDAQCYSMDAAELVRQDRPAIVSWKHNHWCVFAGRDVDDRVAICNPDRGRYRMSEGTFASLATGIEKYPGQVIGIFNGEPAYLGIEANIEAGKLFSYEGKLYRAIIAIARGEQVIEGVNAQLVGVTQVMNDLENKE